MEEKNGQAQYLYISEPGETDNETIVRALKLPVSVTVNINDKGTAVVQLKESDENGKFRFACEFEATPSVKVSENMRLVIDEMELEKSISIAVSGWITIFLRDGIFYIDKKKEVFIHAFDLRDVSKRLSANLDDTYRMAVVFHS